MSARLLVLGVLAAATLGLACESPVGAGGSTEARGGECATCHMPEYTHADHPVHVDKKPTTCGVCHAQEGWRPSVLQHPFWALTGKHETAPCAYCHPGTPPAFKGTPKDCVACHRPEYDASTYPNHQTFPTKCAECHGTSVWKPATKIPPPPPPPPRATTAPVGTLAPLTKTSPFTKTTRTTSNAPPPPTTAPRAPTTPTTPTTRPPTSTPDFTSRASPMRR